MSATTPPVHYRKVDQVIIALALVILPLVPALPPWITGLAVVCGAWRLVAARRGWRNPNRIVTAVVAIACGGGILLTFGQLNSQAAGTALLVAMVALKLMELRGRRDAILLVFLGYFLVVTNFLYSQELPVALWLFPVTIYLTMVLLDINRHGPPLPWRRRLRTAGTLSLQALPLMLVLFVLFPRVPGPLWGVPEPEGVAQSGLSDSMSPGSISQLGLSNELAFRVVFDDAAPDNNQMYWRGPVFWEFDGRSWSADSERYAEDEVTRQPAGLEPLGPSLSYQVTLEANEQHWLLALDMPAATDMDGARYRDGQLLAVDPVRERERYDATSYTAYRLQAALPEERRQRALALPADGNERARELAREWADKYSDHEQIAQRALTLFREESYYYTLEPPLLDEEPIDEFLFDTRSGFCEHYAGAFVFLMRAAGVPARVVTGYLGAERNPLGGYYIVRQSNAHAWAEVWLENHGWVRYDPTGAVSPERIEQGLEAAMEGSGGNGQAWFQLRRMGYQLEMVRDAINAAWDAWVLAYGPERQVEFLSLLGMEDADSRKMATTLGTLMVLLLALLYGWMAWQARTLDADAASREYRRFCQRLSRVGLARAPHEGPVDFARRVAQVRPDLAAGVKRITQLYVQVRYEERDPQPTLEQLRRASRGFRPERRRRPRN